MGRDRDADRGRPVEPGESRAHGNDPDAVEVRRASDREEQLRAEGLGPDIPRRSEPASDRTRYEEAGVSGGTADHGARRLVSGHDDEGRAAARRDSIRWGPIWAGLITALTVFLLLQLLAIGLGLIDIGPGAGGGGWVSAIMGLIAFFIGGSVAGMTSAVRGEATGAFFGLLLSALASMLGGFLGGRSSDPLGRMARE